jgi:hypothetical protein
LTIDASAQNLLENPGFETGDLTGWLVSGESGSASAVVQSGDNGPSEPGTFSVFLNNRSEANNLTLKQTTSVGSAEPGPVFYSFDLKLGQASDGGVFFVEVFAEQSGAGVIGTSGVLGSFTPVEWTAFEGSFDAPVGTDFLTIQLSAITGAVIGTESSMHVDNVSLTQMSAVSVEPTGWTTTPLLISSRNPFTSTTRLSLGLPTTGFASLDVFDAAGRLIITRDLGHLAQGLNDVEFDGRDASGRQLAPGVWFVRARTSIGVSETLRLVRLR